MKINEQEAANLNQLLKRTIGQRARGFEQYLNKQETGDEYYWYHQQQLENSALKFEPLSKEPQAAALQPGSTEADLSRCGQAFARDAQKQSTPLPIAELDGRQSQEANHSENEFAQLVALIKRNIGEMIPNQNSSIHQLKPNSQPTLNSLANKTLFRTVVLKEHQLFIKGFEAEFSFNATNLTQQQTKELSQLVKQVLRNKGIKLQQLIINGVKQ